MGVAFLLVLFSLNITPFILLSNSLSVNASGSWELTSASILLPITINENSTLEAPLLSSSTSKPFESTFLMKIPLHCPIGEIVTTGVLSPIISAKEASKFTLVFPLISFAFPSL